MPRSLTRSTLRLALCVAPLVSLAACARVDEPPAPLGSTASAIVGGTRESGYHFAGYLTWDNPSNVICTGSLVAPNAFLTAAHCLPVAPMATDFWVGFGAPSSGPLHHATAAHIIRHPGARYDTNGGWASETLPAHDIAVMILDRPVMDITPGKLATGTFATACQYRAIGYGRTSAGGYEGAATPPERKSVGYCGESPSLYSATYQVQSSEGGICFGDSGGPLITDGTSTVWGVASALDPVAPGGDYCNKNRRAFFTSVIDAKVFLDYAMNEAARALCPAGNGDYCAEELGAGSNAVLTCQGGQFVKKVACAAGCRQATGNQDYCLTHDDAAAERVFDATFYGQFYSDLRATYGSDATLLARHFVKSGRFEGRLGSATIDPGLYLNTNADVRQSVGATNLGGAVAHFGAYGVGEGRAASLLFDVDDYLVFNPDVAGSTGGARLAALQHFIRSGMNEGRRGSLIFDPTFYRARHPDLAAAYGPNRRAYSNHFLQSGLPEGRRGSRDFDARFYLATNPDLASMLGPGNHTGAANHYFAYGATEQRPPTPERRPPELLGLAIAGSDTTDVHGVTRASGYTSFFVQAKTALSAAPPSKFAFVTGDARGTGRDDLWAIQMNGTGSGTTEVHALGYDSGYASFVLRTATALPQTSPSQFAFAAGDYNDDGRSDLYAVQMNGTASGAMEVHVLDGASNFSRYLARQASSVAAATAGQWQFATGDWDGDGRADLAALRMSGSGTRAVEVHVFSAASGFRQPLFQAATPLLDLTESNALFHVGDYTGDGRPDLFAVLLRPVSGKVEVHVLDGASSLQRFAWQGVTPFGATDRQRTGFVFTRRY